MHKVLLAAAVAAVALGAPAVAGAQIVIQAPPLVGGPPPPPGPPPGPYWRGPAGDWARRHEIREEYRHEAWRRDHCVRDWRGEVFCRR